MRCGICDRILSEPKYNQDYEEFDPCEPCMEVIEDTLEGFKDKPSADEDELGNDTFSDVYEISLDKPPE